MGVVARVAALLLLVACGGRSPTDPQGTPRQLPANFRLAGSAASTESDGSSVSCELDLYFELAANPRRFSGVLEYDGVHGGSVQRTVVDAAGNGLSLWPHVHGAVVARSIAPDRVWIEIPVNTGAGGRFWRELARFEGVFGSGDSATGGWNCAPFDIDSGGYVDTMYTARGTWTLRPTF